MPRRKVSNPLALAVLACLAERPMHPYEMSTTMRERGKHESIKLNYGSLYSVVQSLQKHGLIAPRETVKDGRRPERTVYEITSAGRLEFVDWLSELIGTPVEGLPGVRGRPVADRRPAPGRRVRLLQQRSAQLRSQLQGGAELRRYAAEMGVPELFLDRGGLPARPARGRDPVRRPAGGLDRRRQPRRRGRTGASTHAAVVAAGAGRR